MMAPRFRPTRSASVVLPFASPPKRPLSPIHCAFSAAHFLGHCFRLIPAPGSFAASAFPVPPISHWFPPRMHPLALGAEALAFRVPKENGAEKGDSKMSYLYVKWNRLELRFARRRFRH